MFLLGFDVGEISEDAPDDVEGLDASAAHVANLLSNEPADSRFLLQFLFNIIFHNSVNSFFCNAFMF